MDKCAIIFLKKPCSYFLDEYLINIKHRYLVDRTSA